MNLDVVVTQGCLPWSPNPDAHDLNVWYEFEYPRAGTFETKECTVLFTAVGGFETRTSVWAYTCLTSDEARDLADVTFDSLPDLRHFVETTFAGRRVVLALADDLTVSSWAVADNKGSLYEVATAFLESVLAETRNRQDAGTKFRAKLAQVDVATNKLVDA
jgi:hypothetical protein